MLECPPKKKWVPNTAMTLAPNDKGKVRNISLKCWGTPIPRNLFRKLKVMNNFFCGVKVSLSDFAFGYQAVEPWSRNRIVCLEKQRWFLWPLSISAQGNQRETSPCWAQGQCKPAKKVSEQRKRERAKNGGKNRNQPLTRILQCLASGSETK